VLLAIVAFAATITLCELLLSLAGYGRLVIYAPDHNLYWRPLPDQSVFTKIGRKPVRINSKGTRGPEFATSKPGNVFRILCLGDSRTFGWGLATDETYSSVLQGLLRPLARDHTQVEVINAGVNAWSYPQMLAYLTHTASKYGANVVVLDGANLWTMFTEDQSDEFRRAFAWRVRLKNTLRRSAIYHYVVEVRLQRHYQKYRTKFIPSVERPDEVAFDHGDTASKQPEKVISRIAEVLQLNRADLVLLYIPRQNESGDTLHRPLLAAQRAVATKYECSLVDLTDDFGRATNSLFLEADPIHPNPAGNVSIANSLFSTISSSAAFRDFVSPR
jgi:lysophospholipase L1-like esterase